MVNKKVYKGTRKSRIKNNKKMTRLNQQLKSIIPPKINYSTKPKRSKSISMVKSFGVEDIYNGLSFGNGLVKEVVDHGKKYKSDSFKKKGVVYNKPVDTLGRVVNHPIVNKAVEGFDTSLAAGGPLGRLGLILGGGKSIVKGVKKLSGGVGKILTGRGGKEYDNYIPIGKPSGVRYHR